MDCGDSHRRILGHTWKKSVSPKLGPKAMRSAGQRSVPSEPSLFPLLEALKGKGQELVAPLLSRGDDRNAEIFHAHLAGAKIARPRLTADTATEVPIDFRSLRDSYPTWLALAAVPDKRIQSRRGHASNITTDRYIKAAEAFDIATIAEPFLPCRRRSWASDWTNAWPKTAKPWGLQGGCAGAQLDFPNHEDLDVSAIWTPLEMAI